MWTRRELKERAKEALQRNYWKIVLVSAMLFLLGCEAGGYNFSASLFKTESGAEENRTEQAAKPEKTVVSVNKDFEINVFDGILFATASIVIFMVVLCILFSVILLTDLFLINPFDVGGKRFLCMSLEGKAQVKEIAYGFDNSYKNVVKVMFFRDLYIILWTLLLVIPGIVKMYQYLMVPYLLAEHPDMEYHAALRMSRDMMEGNKWRAFVLDLSFILWDFLGMLTLGVLELLYVNPYRNLTFAALYCKLKSGCYQKAGNGECTVTETIE